MNFLNRSRPNFKRKEKVNKIETIEYISGNCLFLREVQAITLSSLLDSKLFYGSLRLSLVIIHELLLSVQEVDLSKNLMRLYLKSVFFLDDAKQKFLQFTNFYSENIDDINFEDNNIKYYSIDFARLFNKKSEQELLLFTQKNMNDEIFSRRVYILRELYLAKKNFNIYMFELLEGLSEQAKEKIALGLGQEGIDVMDVKIDAMYIKKQFQETLGKKIAEKHLSVDILGEIKNIDLQAEEIIYSLLQTEENVIFIFLI